MEINFFVFIVFSVLIFLLLKMVESIIKNEGEI